MALAYITSLAMMHLNSRAFRCFLHDVHHAYLLLHRAMQTLPPTSIPDLEPMPHPSEGISSQYAELHPAGEHGEAPDLPSSAFPNSLFEVEDSASEKFFNEIMTHTAEEDDPAEAPAPIFQPLPRPVRHVSAPEPHELPQPKPKTAVKKPAKRPRAKKSPTTKRPSSPSHSEAASP